MGRPCSLRPNVKGRRGLGQGCLSRAHVQSVTLVATLSRPWLKLAPTRDPRTQLQHWASFTLLSKRTFAQKAKRGTFFSWACGCITPVSALVFAWPSPCVFSSLKESVS